MGGDLVCSLSSSCTSFSGFSGLLLSMVPIVGMERRFKKPGMIR